MKSLRLCSISLALLTIIALSATVVDAEYHHVSDGTGCRCVQTGECRSHAQPAMLMFPPSRLQHEGTIACKEWERGGLKCAA